MNWPLVVKISSLEKPTINPVRCGNMPKRLVLRKRARERIRGASLKPMFMLISDQLFLRLKFDTKQGCGRLRVPCPLGFCQYQWR